MLSNVIRKQLTLSNNPGHTSVLSEVGIGFTVPLLERGEFQG